LFVVVLRYSDIFYYYIQLATVQKEEVIEERRKELGEKRRKGRKM